MHSLISISAANQKVMQTGAKHLVLHSAITGTMADPVAHISTMKMDDGMLVVDSALGHLVQGLAPPRRAERKQDLEAMACVPVVACVVVSVCERALVACASLSGAATV